MARGGTLQEEVGGGSRPVPDPTVLTTQQLYREITALREIIEARLDGTDKIIGILQDHLDQRQVQINAAVVHLQKLHEEKFGSIATQFIERDKRTEQLSLADKTAIAAALQAQKEAAGATNESNSVALTKMETNFAKLIDQGQTLLQSVVRNTDEKINDLKSRLDRGEGRTSVSDPAAAEGMKLLASAIESLKTSRDQGTGHTKGMSDISGWVVAVAGLIIAVAVAVFHKGGP
jgi:hypothetical protein